MQTQLALRSSLRTAAAVLLATATLVSAAPAQSPCSSSHRSQWFPNSWPSGSGGLAFSMDISDDGRRLAAGVPGAQHLGLDVGAIYALTDFGTPQQQEHVLLPSIPTPQRRFGWSLAMSASGDVLVGGAPGVTWGGAGRAFVFRFNGQTWVEEQIFTSPYGDSLSRSVDISDDGNLIALGAPERSPWPNYTTGAVDIYRHNGTSWILEASLTRNSTLTHPSVGHYVSLSGDGRYLATMCLEVVNSVTRTFILIYESVGNSWVQRAMFTDPAGQSGSLNWNVLDLDARGETLAFGNWQDNRIISSQGAVTLYRRSGSTWNYDSVLLPASPTHSGAFGFHLALNSAGDRLIVGAPSQFQGTYRGVVEEFELFLGGANRLAVHLAPTFSDLGQFGRRVAINAVGDRWIASKPLADTYGPDFGEVHVFEANCLTPQVYCTAPPNTLNCVPSISFQGTPSISSPTGFVISASQVRNRQNGMLFYGTNGRASLPWHSGTLCVAPPLRRTPVINSLGSPVPANDCSGVLARDFNAWAFAASDTSLFAGQHVRAQFYGRDPGAPGDISLTDALEFYLEP